MQPERGETVLLDGPSVDIEPRPGHVTRLTRISLGIAIAVAAAIAVGLWWFDWNMLRGPAARYVGHKLDRHVEIKGSLDVDLSLHPRVQVDDLVIGNAAWSREPLMLEARQLSFRFDLGKALLGDVRLMDLTLVEPRLLLERAADGRANWQFGDGSAATGRTAPAIEQLSIDDGTVRYLDPTTNADVLVNVRSVAQPAAGPSQTAFSGSGRWRNEPFTIEGEAAPLLSLRDRDAPFALKLRVKAGTTSVRYEGTLVPSDIRNVDGELTLEGRDLSRLYPIVPAPLPWTPPYRLSGHLRHVKGVWSFDAFKGKVGDSDIAGTFSVDKQGDKPKVKANLTSRLLDYKDLGGLVGLPPKDVAPPARTAEQNREAAKRAASGHVLPSARYHPERLRTADMDVTFHGRRFMASKLPLDDLDTRLVLADGVLKLEPLDFGVAGGHVVARITIDARKDVMKVDGDFTARNLELKDLVPQLRAPNVSAGKVGGRAKLAGTGNSIAQMLASSNGQVALISRGGEASTLTLVLSNLDLARATELLLRGDEKSTIRCVVAGFGVERGTMSAQTLLMDTEAVKIIGSGSVDLADEQYDLRLEAKSKHPSLLALRGPIRIDGSFKQPGVHPEIGPLAARIGASIVLGTLLTPLAALLPLIDTGGATNADCHALVGDVQRAAGRK